MKSTSAARTGPNGDEPFYLSPLDDRFVRLKTAAVKIAARNPKIEPGQVLDLLVRAMWNGAFEPEHMQEGGDGVWKADADVIMWVPIQLPRHKLTEAQLAIEPRPVEDYQGHRRLALEVIYCLPGLPGNPMAWTRLLEPPGEFWMKRKDEAYRLLQGYDVSVYPEAGRTFLESVSVCRRTLQDWIDDQASGYENLFAPSKPEPETDAASAEDPSPEEISPAATGDKASARRGRPKSPAWAFIRLEIVRLHTAEPTLLHKVLAARVRALALQQFDAPDVPGESSILRSIPEMLGGPKPWEA